MNGLNLSLSNQSKHKKNGDEAESDKEKQLEAFWNQAWHPVFKTGGLQQSSLFFYILKDYYYSHSTECETKKIERELIMNQ